MLVTLHRPACHAVEHAEGSTESRRIVEGDESTIKSPECGLHTGSDGNINGLAGALAFGPELSGTGDTASAAFGIGEIMRIGAAFQFSRCRRGLGVV